MKMEQTECPETSAYKIQMQENRPQVIIQRAGRSPQFFKICKANSVDRLCRRSQKSFHFGEAEDIFNSHFQLLCGFLCVLVPAFFKMEEKLGPGTGIAQVALVYQWS
jgi:hypothetical protein